MPDLKGTSSNNKNFLLIIISVVIVLIVGFFVYQNYKLPLPAITSLTQTETPKGAIAKVGEEYIYQTDLDLAVSLYPATKSADLNKQILNKLIDDSIILQAAKGDKIATIDVSEKDLTKRAQAIEQIRSSINNQAKTISGSVIIIWFLNNPSYQQNALSRITQMHNDLLTKKITLTQAKEIIIRDTSQPDVNKINSIIDFENKQKTLVPITFDKNLDNILWTLSEGQISNINLIKYTDPKTGLPVDSAYALATVTKISGNSQILNFDDWLSQKRRDYAVKYY